MHKTNSNNNKTHGNDARWAGVAAPGRLLVAAPIADHCTTPTATLKEMEGMHAGTCKLRWPSKSPPTMAFQGWMTGRKEAALVQAAMDTHCKAVLCGDGVYVGTALSTGRVLALGIQADALWTTRPRHRVGSAM